MPVQWRLLSFVQHDFGNKRKKVSRIDKIVLEGITESKGRGSTA